MRTAITIGIRADGTTALLSGVEVPITDQRQAMKRGLHAASGEFEVIELWESGSGRFKRHRVKGATVAAAPATAADSATAPEVVEVPSALEEYRAKLGKLSTARLAEVASNLGVTPGETRAATIDLILAAGATDGD